jgi:hypothetical protein
METEKVTYKGGCHCKKVRFEVLADKTLTIFNCNCSICNMKQNHHFIVYKDSFKLLEGEEDLTTYTFNTGQAKHKFCKNCGVQSFYHPRSHPDGIAVTIYCLDDYPNIPFKFINFDGVNWEAEMNRNEEIHQHGK